MMQGQELETTRAAVEVADPTLLADLQANLAALQQLAPPVIEALMKIRDHLERIDQAITTAGVDGPIEWSADHLPCIALLDQAYKLADAIDLVHPDNAV